MPMSAILLASISKPSIHLLQSTVGSASLELIQIKAESRYPVSSARGQTQKPTAIFIRPALSTTRSHSVQPIRKDCILRDLSDDKRVFYPSDVRVYHPSCLHRFHPWHLRLPHRNFSRHNPIRVSISNISRRGGGVESPRCASVGRYRRLRALWRLEILRLAQGNDPTPGYPEFFG